MKWELVIRFRFNEFVDIMYFIFCHTFCFVFYIPVELLSTWSFYYFFLWLQHKYLWLLKFKNWYAMAEFSGME